MSEMRLCCQHSWDSFLGPASGAPPSSCPRLRASWHHRSWLRPRPSPGHRSRVRELCEWHPRIYNISFIYSPAAAAWHGGGGRGGGGRSHQHQRDDHGVDQWEHGIWSRDRSAHLWLVVRCGPSCPASTPPTSAMAPSLPRPPRPCCPPTSPTPASSCSGRAVNRSSFHNAWRKPLLGSRKALLRAFSLLEVPSSTVKNLLTNYGMG